MKVMRKIVKIDQELCNGCGNCVIDCHEAAIEIVNGKAKVVKESLCDGIGDCLGGCPMDAITIEEREADPYSEEDVQERIASMQAVADGMQYDDLRQWPVKIRLVSPDAEVFKGQELVIAADCAAFASPDFHKRYRKGAPVVIGCPKFEDPSIYMAKFEEIFARAGVTGCRVVRMEVPCCGGLARAAEAAAEKYGVNVAIEIVGINR